MKYYINDQALHSDTSISLLDALNDYLSIQPIDANYVVAINQNFVPRNEYSATLLSNGDKIELLSPMAGG